MPAAPSPSPANPTSAVQFDLFLSHNSVDKPLVEGVAEQLLEEAGWHCWIDIWSIPAASDWEAEIMKAITTCRATVVFYGSSGWGPWHSREALLAMKYAAQHPEYRVIPVRLAGFTLAVPSPEDDTNGDLTKLYESRHVVSLDIHRGDFIEQIKSALGAEPPHPMGRTRITPYVIRRDARRWAAATLNRGVRHPSRLYRGRQLEEALPVSKEHPGQLDALAMEFLQASIARRKTLAWRWFGGCLVGVLVLAIMAYREAQARSVATSRLYATLSERELTHRHLGTSALLAVAAWQEAPTDTARTRVLDTTARFPHLRSVLLEKSADDMTGGWSATSRDQRFFALCSDETLRLWSLSSDTSAPTGSILQTGSSLGPVAFTDNGRLAAVADSKLQVWKRPLDDTTDQHVFEGLSLSNSGLAALQGNKLAAVDSAGRLCVIDLDSGNHAELAPESSGWTKLAAIPETSAVTKAFIVADDAGNLRLFTATPDVKSVAHAKVPGEGSIQFLAASPDLRKVVVRRSDSPAMQGTLPDGQWTTLGQDVTMAQYLADGTLLTGYRDGALKVWPADFDPSQPPLMDLSGHHGHVVTASATGSMVITSDTEVTTLLWNLGAHALRQQIWRLDGEPIEDVVWSGDGNHLAAATSGGKCYFWNPFSQEHDLRSQDIPAAFLRLDDCGKHLLTCSNDGVISSWERHEGNWTHLQTIKTEKAITAMARGKNLVVLGTKTGELIAWHMTSKGLRSSKGTPFTAHARAVRSLSFTQNGRLLGSSSADGAVKLWNTQRLSEDAKIFGAKRDNGRANFLALLPNGESYLVGGATNILEHWRRQAGDPRLFAGMPQENGIGAFTTDPAVEYAVTTDMFTNVATLWHIPSSQLVLSISDLGGMVTVLAHSPSRPVVAVGTHDGKVMLVNLDPKRAAEHLLRVANRNLSPREWTQFMGKIPYRKLNPNLPEGEDRVKSYD